MLHTIFRLLLCGASFAWLVGPPHANAQVLVSPALADDIDQKQVAKSEDEPTVISIRAASEPDPAMRYRFWPAAQDQRNVNAMPFVSRAILMTVQAMRSTEARREFADKHDAWREMPLSELPIEEARGLVQRLSSNALGELERAENYMHVEYDLRFEDMSANQMILTLLPEYQEMRTVARLLSLRARLAAAEGRWDDFARDCRLSFRLSEAAGRSSDFLIGRLVGFAIAGVTMQNIQDAMQHPDCPSFYWALATIPDDRLFETQQSIEFESVLLSRLLDRNDLPDEPIGAEAARKLILKLGQDSQDLLGSNVGQVKDEQAAAVPFLSGLFIVAMADTAREALEATPQWKGRTEELSSAEAVLRFVNLRFVRLRDSWVKWSLLPPELAGEYEKEIEAAIGKPAPTDVLRTLVLQLTPAVRSAARAGLRSRQHKNFLLTIESLRLHAAEFGELPRDLNKLRPVPAWHDSIALRPFGYVRTSVTTATLVREPRHPNDSETNFKIQLILEGEK